MKSVNCLLKLMPFFSMSVCVTETSLRVEHRAIDFESCLREIEFRFGQENHPFQYKFKTLNQIQGKATRNHPCEKFPYRRILSKYLLESSIFYMANCV